MPAMQAVHDDGGAFTVINHEGKARERLVAADPPLARNVNVVKPLRRADDQREHFNSACTRPQPPAPEPPAAAPQPRTILDPKFSRALDFKLRRLKEKEILKENLRRPTRYKPRNGLAASSIPNISCKERVTADSLSRSHPRIDSIPPLDDSTPKMETTPSPGRRARGLVATRSMIDNDKPRFVTTVKSGQFLLPPPEVATLLGLETLYPPQEREKIVYSYASKPKALASRAKRSPPEPKKEVIPNGVVSTGAGAGAGPVSRRPHVGGVGGALSGVRALVAGVVGLRHLHHAHGTDTQARASGSVTTSAPYSNVMHERRVVRGSTFATHPPHAAAGDGAESAAARAARTRRRAAARRAAARLRPGTPPPAPGRRHHPIQTEYYLEELFDKGVEMEVGVQTDLFVDRPATPVYVPAKTGADAATQIYPGDLFDFDLEVQPILEVLVGKTTEQALAEVAQEEELATLREQQRRYCELRDAERAERQRLAAQHTRLHNEKERRVSEARAAALAAEEARSRAAAAALVQGYVAELLPSALAGLRDQGYLVERIERGVDEEFMPWLVQEVSREIESIITSRDVITEIVREVVEGRSELYRGAGEREAAASPPLESITPPSVPDGEGEAGTLFGPHSIYHQMPVRSLYRATMNTNMSPRKDLEE